LQSSYKHEIPAIIGKPLILKFDCLVSDITHSEEKTWARKRPTNRRKRGTPPAVCPRGPLLLLCSTSSLLSLYEHGMPAMIGNPLLFKSDCVGSPGINFRPGGKDEEDEEDEDEEDEDEEIISGILSFKCHILAVLNISRRSLTPTS